MMQANRVDWFVLIGKTVTWIILGGLFMYGVYVGGTQQ